MKALAARIALAAWTVFLGASMWFVVHVDLGRPFGPVTFALRIAVLGLGGWLLAATAIELARAPRRITAPRGWLAHLVVAAAIATPSSAWAAGGDVVMTRIPPPSSTTTTAVVASAPPPPPAASPQADSYTVVPGDSLWRIARHVLADAWGRQPSNAAMTPYWIDVVDAARPSLRDPGDPDLIYPGQVLPLPSPPPAP